MHKDSLFISSIVMILLVALVIVSFYDVPFLGKLLIIVFGGLFFLLAVGIVFFVIYLIVDEILYRKRRVGREDDGARLLSE